MCCGIRNRDFARNSRQSVAYFDDSIGCASTHDNDDWIANQFCIFKFDAW
jgi:hypothetical protein